MTDRQLRRVGAATLALAALVAVVPVHAATPDAMDPKVREDAKASVERGLQYLRGREAADGSWSKSVGVTALALQGFLQSPKGYK